MSARDQILAKLVETCIALEERVGRLEHAACVESRRNMMWAVLKESKTIPDPRKPAKKSPPKRSKE